MIKNIYFYNNKYKSALLIISIFALAYFSIFTFCIHLNNGDDLTFAKFNVGIDF